MQYLCIIMHYNLYLLYIHPDTKYVNSFFTI